VPGTSRMSLFHEMHLALRLLARDYRAGELTLIALAIVIAVASVTTVAFFTDRVQRTLDQQANRLLGADLVISDTRPIAPVFEEEALRRGLAAIGILRFPSMVLSGERNQLADVMGVAPGYPLRGEVRVAEQLFGPDRRAGDIPERGTVWLDERLHTGLELDAGARVTLGDQEFPVSAIITHEPGVAVGFLSGQPRLMLNRADLDATGLIGPGSRVRYRLMVAGGAAEVEAYRAWAGGQLGPGQRIEGVRDARPEIRSALERAQRFTNLAALAAVLLAAVAIALAARRYHQRHLDGCAVMRCAGASGSLIVRLHVIHFVVLGVAASSLGIALGGAAQEVLSGGLGRFFAVALAPPGAAPGAQGMVVGLLLLLGFALPPLVDLGRVPPLRVLRRELGAPQGAGLLGYALGTAVICGLIVWRAQEFRFALTVLAWLGLAVAGAGGLTWVTLRLLAWLPARSAEWRFAVTGLQRRPLGTTLQVVALALGMMALLTLTLVRGDLMRTWETSLPPDAPNRFLANIQPDQVAALAGFLDQAGMRAPQMFPMVRGRLVRISDRAVSADDYQDDRARRLVTREFNLSWAARLQPDNRIVAGAWWEEPVSGAAQYSVEQGLAERLGIRLGDTLTFDVAGSPAVGRVASLRSVEWDSFNVNFFVLAAPGLLDRHAATYVTSFHLPRGEAGMLNGLVRAFPNVVLIDVAQALSQVRHMMDQAAYAVQFVFLFTLVAGLTVLYAAIAGTLDERLYRAAVLRALGASRRQVTRVHLAEFAVIGAVAGFVAAAGASGLAYFVSTRFLGLDYAQDPAVWVIGVAGGALAVAVAGHFGTRRVLGSPPLAVLRTAA
jgi:putative ABC transport system permease protein